MVINHNLSSEEEPSQNFCSDENAGILSKECKTEKLIILILQYKKKNPNVKI